MQNDPNHTSIELIRTHNSIIISNNTSDNPVLCNINLEQNSSFLLKTEITDGKNHLIFLDGTNKFDLGIVPDNYNTALLSKELGIQKPLLTKIHPFFPNFKTIKLGFVRGLAGIGVIALVSYFYSSSESNQSLQPIGSYIPPTTSSPISQAQTQDKKPDIYSVQEWFDK